MIFGESCFYVNMIHLLNSCRKEERRIELLGISSKLIRLKVSGNSPVRYDLSLSG